MCSHGQNGKTAPRSGSSVFELSSLEEQFTSSSISRGFQVKQQLDIYRSYCPDLLWKIVASKILKNFQKNIHDGVLFYKEATCKALFKVFRITGGK